MSHRAPLVSALAIVALFAVAPVAASPTGDPEAPFAYVRFNLDANHGLRAQVEAINGEVTLKFVRKGRKASYVVPAESSEAGLKARFGKLGLIDVAFSLTKTLRTEEPPKECEGEPSTHSEGVFTGTIEFAGERDFVRIDAARAEGRMSVPRESEWKCPRGKEPIHPRGAPQHSVLSHRLQSEAEEEELATLAAFSLRCRCQFGAFAARTRGEHGPTFFYGARLENREGMEIVRSTTAGARPSSFVFDHAAGTATVRPPRPFSGSGTFERRAHRRELWRSTIRVPLLGAAPVSVRGRGFQVALVRDYPSS